MSVQTDTIQERTTAAGVTIDGLLLKDGGLPNLPGAGLTADQAAALAAYEAALAAATAGQVLTASEPGVAAFAAAGGGGGLPGDPTRIVLVVSQSGTSAPVVTTIHNDTGLTITPSYMDVGFYILTFSGTLFASTPDPNAGLIVSFGSDSNAISNLANSYHAVAISSAELVLVSIANHVATNAVFNNSTLVIDVYAVP